MNILEAMADPELFARFFKRSWLRGDTWQAWRVFLAALFGLSMGADALEVYRRHTGRNDAPAEPFGECFVIAGRRSGKSLVAALVAVFLACFRDYRGVLAPGETGVVMLIASDRRQARVLLGYINGFFDSIPMLARMVVSRLKESVELTNRVRIEIHTSSFRAVRGYTILAAICDELAFWPSEDSASPDVEVLNALRPAMATVSGALLLGISSPYARRGALWEAYREHYGKPGALVLVWQAETRAMNPSVSRLTVDAAYLRDQAAASAEYGAQFRSDVEGFLTLEVVESRVVPQRFELPPLEDTTCVAFVDPSGGQSDSMTLAIAHFQRDCAVLDVLRERLAPFSPEEVVAEFAELLKRYRVSTVTGDRYGGEWPREQFWKRGIQYRPAEKTRSDLYLELLPAVMSGQVELLDNRQLVAQLVGLERRTARSGRDCVDHSPGAHDDVANAAAGALVEALLVGSGGGFGLIDYYKSGAAEAELNRLEKPPVSITLAKSTTPDPPCCPQCGETRCIARLAGQWRCNQCGNQWPKVKVLRGPSRADLFR